MKILPFHNVTPSNFPTLHKDGSVTYRDATGQSITCEPDELPAHVRQILGYENVATQLRRASRARLAKAKVNPRFVLAVGSYAEAYPDLPADLPTACIYDRDARKVVATLSPEYVQVVCLERSDSEGWSGFAEWLNGLSRADLRSEGIAPTE